MRRCVYGVDLQRDQPALRSRTNPFNQRGLPDEVWLVHLYKPIKARLKRIKLGQDIGFSVQKSLFKTH